MRFYMPSHEAYCGIDLHARTIYVCMSWRRVCRSPDAAHRVMV